MMPVFVPGEMVCKNEKSFKGTLAEYIFMHGKLTEIRLARISTSPTLVRWAEKIYGARRDKPSSFYKDQPNAEWLWTNINSTTAYSLMSDLNNHVIESIVIQSRKHQDLFEKFGKDQDKAYKGD